MDESQRALQYFDKTRPWLQRLSDRFLARKGSRASLKSLPSFFIVGPPRTGTSWLHEILREHSVLPVATKETRFFDTHFHRGLEWYLAHFPHARDRFKVGEVAPTYFASVEARQRIARLLPNARIVCIFRNPVDRIVSLYRVKRAYGLTPWTLEQLEQAILEDPEFLNTSRYAENFRAWQNVLGPDQVLPTLYDDLCDDPQAYLDRLAKFIGVPRFRLTSSQRHSVHASDQLTHPRSYTCTRNATRLANWLKAQRFDKLVAAVRESPVRQFLLGSGQPFTPPTRELAARLHERFLPEVEMLEETLQRPLPAWKCGGGEAPTCTASGLHSLEHDSTSADADSPRGAVA
jgi:hypothetical protein